MSYLCSKLVEVYHLFSFYKHTDKASTHYSKQMKNHATECHPNQPFWFTLPKCQEMKDGMKLTPAMMVQKMLVAGAKFQPLLTYGMVIDALRSTEAVPHLNATLPNLAGIARGMLQAGWTRDLESFRPTKEWEDSHI